MYMSRTTRTGVEEVFIGGEFDDPEVQLPLVAFLAREGFSFRVPFESARHSRFPVIPDSHVFALNCEGTHPVVVNRFSLLEKAFRTYVNSAPIVATIRGGSSYDKGIEYVKMVSQIGHLVEGFVILKTARFDVCKFVHFTSDLQLSTCAAKDIEGHTCEPGTHFVCDFCEKQFCPGYRTNGDFFHWCDGCCEEHEKEVAEWEQRTHDSNV